MWQLCTLRREGEWKGEEEGKEREELDVCSFLLTACSLQDHVTVLLASGGSRREDGSASC